MGGSSVLSFTSSKTYFPFNPCIFFSSSRQLNTVDFHCFHWKQVKNVHFFAKNRNILYVGRDSALFPPPFAVAEALEQTSVSLSSPREMASLKIDKNGRFCSPRAAREFALLIVYAACLEGSDPVRLFEKRVNAKRYPGFGFDKASLLEYDHMSFGGAPVSTETEEEAEELRLKDLKESEIETDVLLAPPKLVYNKFVLRQHLESQDFTHIVPGHWDYRKSLARRILVAVVDRWDQHVFVIDKITPPTWKNEPAGRILELCILHLAMAEITVIGTRHQIVINEAVDLTKRFCDGSAPRIINGCLRTFVKDHKGVDMAQPLKTKS